MDQKRVEHGVGLVLLAYLATILLGLLARVMPFALSWTVYVVYFFAIGFLQEIEPAIKPLKKIVLLVGALTLLQVLVVIEFQLISASDIYTPWMLVDFITFILHLFFFFQLFTSLSHIAGKFGLKEEKSLLTVRTVYTICISILYVSVFFVPLGVLRVLAIFFVITGFVGMAVELWITKVLFCFWRGVKKVGSQVELSPH